MSIASISNNPLGYQGLDLSLNPPITRSNRSPSVNDDQVSGSIWINQTTQTAYISSGSGVWGATGAGAAVSTITGNTGGAISPIAGNLNIVGTGGVSVAGAGSTLTISSTGGLTWNIVGVNTAMLTNNGYVATAGAMTLTMPSLASVGDQLGIIDQSAGAGVLTVQCGAGQILRLGNVNQGPSNTFFTTTAQGGATILFVCVVASTSSSTGSWTALSYVGTWNTI